MIELFNAKCSYVISPQKSKISPDDYIIAKFTTSSENIPLKFRNGQSSVTFTAKGRGFNVNKKFETLFEGKWNYSKKYNSIEFLVEKSDVLLPSDSSGIKEYLSTFLNGCGPRTAEKIYNQFGQATLLVLQSAPERLTEVKGLRQKQVERMIKSYNSSKHLQELSILLIPFGISKIQIEKIYAKLGKSAVSMIREDAFCLYDKFHFSFDLLESISLSLSCNAKSVLRIRAAILHVLKLAQSGSYIFDDPRLKNGGNLFVNQYILRDAALKILNSRSDSNISVSEINNVFWTMYNDYSLLGENGNVYLPNDFYDENKLAEYIVNKVVHGDCKKYSDDECIKTITKVEKESCITLSDNQKNAVKMVLQNSLSVITGGAGTGKTTVQKVILSCLENLGEDMNNVILAAPTGKAAILMSERTDYPASTLHKALGLVSDEDYYKKETEFASINSNLIICDEFSMVDNFIAYRLFASADSLKTRILLVGDVGQLPSVGAGKVLKDIIDSKVVPTTKLNVIYRQANESNIVSNSHNISKGIRKLQFGDDFKFFELDNIGEVVDKVIEQYLISVKKYGLDNTIILSPVKKRGEYCTTELNNRVQEIINPKTEKSKEKKVNNIIFRTFDRVIQLKNRDCETIDGKTVDLCNGDTGYIKDIIHTEEGYEFVINFSGNRQVIYTVDDMKKVNLAYAITVHKSQGSEYKSVIMPLVQNMPQAMITRNLIYTAITRAKTEITIVGQKQCLYKAINNNVAYNRNTALSDKIIKCKNY